MLGKNMTLTAQNLVRHELTGMEVEVVISKDPNKIGIKGVVVEESKNLLTIKTSKNETKIPKKECVFRFKLGGQKIDINGEKLVGRPEDRIKR